jgi:hypothetical protein
MRTAVIGSTGHNATAWTRAFREAILAQGAPSWLGDIWQELAEELQSGRAGHVGKVTPDVTEVTGRAPRSLEHFLAGEFPARADGT